MGHVAVSATETLPEYEGLSTWEDVTCVVQGGVTDCWGGPSAKTYSGMMSDGEIQIGRWGLCSRVDDVLICRRDQNEMSLGKVDSFGVIDDGVVAAYNGVCRRVVLGKGVKDCGDAGLVKGYRDTWCVERTSGELECFRGAHSQTVSSYRRFAVGNGFVCGVDERGGGECVSVGSSFSYEGVRFLASDNLTCGDAACCGSSDQGTVCWGPFSDVSLNGEFQGLTAYGTRFCGLGNAGVVCKGDDDLQTTCVPERFGGRRSDCPVLPTDGNSAVVSADGTSCSIEQGELVCDGLMHSVIERQRLGPAIDFRVLVGGVFWTDLAGLYFSDGRNASLVARGRVESYDVSSAGYCAVVDGGLVRHSLANGDYPQAATGCSMADEIACFTDELGAKCFQQGAEVAFSGRVKQAACESKGCCVLYQDGSVDCLHKRVGIVVPPGPFERLFSNRHQVCGVVAGTVRCWGVLNY